MTQNYRKILIVRTDRIGDVILTLPMARELKKIYPQVQISLLIRQYTAELVEGDPSVDDVIFYDANGKHRQLFSLVKTIKEEQFDLVFHTHPIVRLAFITWCARIPLRIGTGYRWYSFFFNRKIYEHRKYAEHHELEYNLHLLRAIGCDIKDGTVQPKLSIQKESYERTGSLLNDLGIKNNHRLVILHPGSGRSACDWSAKHFGVLGKLLSELPDVKVIIAGGENEQLLMNEVKSYSGDLPVTLVNRLTLKEYAALLKHADLVIANSTGPIHIAAAVGVPVIGFYPQIKSMSAARWGPYTGQKTIFTPESKPVDCKKCLHRKDKSCECMDSISPGEVLIAAQKMLFEENRERMAITDAV